MESALAIIPARPESRTHLLLPKVAPETPETMPKMEPRSIVDPVNGIADPAGGVRAALVSLGQHLVQKGLWIGRRADSATGLPADQSAELAIVILLVFDDPVQDGQAGRIAERFELLAVLGDVAALIDFQAAQGQIVAPDAGLEAAGITGGASPYRPARGSPSSRKRPAHSAACSFSARAMFSSVCLRVGLRLPLGERPIGVIAGHLGLPVLFQNLAQPRVAGQVGFGCRVRIQSLLSFRWLRAQRSHPLSWRLSELKMEVGSSAMVG